MIADRLNIEQFEAELWKIADDLRANSGLASNEYFMPIMGLPFLRYATNHYYEALAAIEADKAADKMPDPARGSRFSAPSRADAARSDSLRRILLGG
jgi:type I restriction enzyme M protein